MENGARGLLERGGWRIIGERILSVDCSLSVDWKWVKCDPLNYLAEVSDHFTISKPEVGQV